MNRIIRGVVRDGVGQGKGFTQLAWVREQFRVKLGFDPYPGTLNLQIENPASIAAWRTQPGIAIEPTPGFCAARCYRVRLNGQIAVVWIIPAVPGYPNDLLELMAPLSLRQHLALKTGDGVEIQMVEEQG